MTVMVASRSLVVREVTTSGSARRGQLEGFEIHGVRLGAMAYLLGTTVATFDAVEAAVALDDIRCCPLCRSHPRDRAGTAASAAVGGLSRGR
jgi:hypothetical protein